MDEESGADYYSDVRIIDRCAYLERESGDTVEISDLEQWRIMEELEKHSERMATMGFRPPALYNSDGWDFVIYPGDCLCSDDACCETESDSELFAQVESQTLYVRAVGEEQDLDQSFDIAYQLFHAVKGSYFPFYEQSEESHCAPFCWIGEGMATMMAWTGAMDSDPPSDRKFDESLFTNDFAKGQQSGLFWLTTAATFDERVLHKVLEQDFSTNHGLTGHGVYQTHQALLELGVEKGFLNAFGTFARHLQDEKYYSSVEVVEPDETDSEYVMTFEDIQPISVQARKIKIDPRHFREL